MKFDGTDVVVGKAFYKDHVYNGQKVRVFVDWGASVCEDFVILGSPFQLTGGGYSPAGANQPDSGVYVDWEQVHTSEPQFGYAKGTTTVGPLHVKAGVNI